MNASDPTERRRHNMAHMHLSKLDDDALLREYQRSAKRLASLDPSTPSWVREIRVAYHDYLDQEMAARGLRTSDEGMNPTVDADG